MLAWRPPYRTMATPQGGEGPSHMACACACACAHTCMHVSRRASACAVLLCDVWCQGEGERGGGACKCPCEHNSWWVLGLHMPLWARQLMSVGLAYAPVSTTADECWACICPCEHDSWVWQRPAAQHPAACRSIGLSNSPSSDSRAQGTKQAKQLAVVQQHGKGHRAGQATHCGPAALQTARGIWWGRLGRGAHWPRARLSQHCMGMCDVHVRGAMVRGLLPDAHGMCVRCSSCCVGRRRYAWHVVRCSSCCVGRRRHAWHVMISLMSGAACRARGVEDIHWLLRGLGVGVAGASYPRICNKD